VAEPCPLVSVPRAQIPRMSRQKEYLALVERARVTRDAAVSRLIEIQQPDGSWHLPVDHGGLAAAMMIIMLRTTGLITRPGQFQLELELVRGLHERTNNDGGFWKYERGPSSLLQTQVCVTALRLVMGEVPPGRRPAAWFVANPFLASADEAAARAMLATAGRFLIEKPVKVRREFDDELVVIARVLISHADEAIRLSWILRLLARLSLCLSQRHWLSDVGRNFHCFAQAQWPSVTILAADASASDRDIQALAQRVRDAQDPDGSWELQSLAIILNMMALAKAGPAGADSAIERAHAWILDQHVTRSNGRAFMAAMRSHVGYTGFGLTTLVRSPQSATTAAAIRRAVEFVLAAQTSSGGWAWGSYCRRDADADTTSIVLRSFPDLALLMEPSVVARLRRPTKHAVQFILARQHRGGGFSCYQPNCWRGRAGSRSVIHQLLFDAPTADVTARILEVLLDRSLDSRNERVRRALRFLFRMQMSNGSWWSRWWAGYIPGTCFCLRAYGQLGLQVGEIRERADPLLRRSHSAMSRGITFLIQHQNADGGWGETVRSDEDQRFAGIGPSTPLHTALVVSSLLSVKHPVGHAVITRAMSYLLGAMSGDGRCDAHEATFTCFARSLYCRFEFLNYVLPLDALNAYLRAVHQRSHRFPRNV
jgi:squalene cyclase